MSRIRETDLLCDTDAVEYLRQKAYQLGFDYRACCASLGHAAWDGMVLCVDDPWWERHLPPKAWGCLCRVIQLGERQIGRLGAEVVKAPEERYTAYINPRNGNAQKAPVGVDVPFSFPPGSRPNHC